MKTRENELHEPLIGTCPLVGSFMVAAKCSVCDYTIEFEKGKNQEEATKKIMEKIPTHCPKCGARIKEI